MLSIKKLLKKMGLWTVLILITSILTTSFGFILNHFKLNENVVIGIPVILMFYFWGGYFLRKHGRSKVLGIVLFIVAIALNFVFISSPYDTASEFKVTRVFLLFPLLASIFLILRKGKISRLMGVLVIILTVLSALLGAAFCSSCQTPQSDKTSQSDQTPQSGIETYSVSISNPNTKTTDRYQCSSPSYDNKQAKALTPSDSLRQKLVDQVTQINIEVTQLNEMGGQSPTNNYNILLDAYNAHVATYETDEKQYNSEMQAYEDYIKARCTYVGN